MLTFLSQKFRFLLVVVLFVIGISFVFFGSWTPRGERISIGNLGMIEGRKISYDDLAAAQKDIQIMRAFQTGQLTPRDERDDEMTYQIWQRLLALAAAKEANIQVTDQEVVDAIRANPLFAEKGKFSSALFQNFFQFYLTPMGVTSDRFQEMVRDETMIKRLFKQIGSTAAVTSSEVNDVFNRLFGKAELEAVSFSLNEIQKTIKPTGEELEAFYKNNSSAYVNPERRKVEYVEFILSDVEQKLSEKEKSKALSVLGEKVFNFIGNFSAESQEKISFKEMAAKYGLTVRQPSEFVTQNQSFLPQYKQPDLARVIFDLGSENSVSDYVPFENGFLVFHLLEVKLSAPIPFQEAKKQVQQDFVQQKAVQLMKEQADQFIKEVKKQMAEGVPWNKAVANLKRKSTSIPAFVPAEATALKMEAADKVNAAAQQLTIGQLSDFLQTPTGGMIIYLKNRAAPSEEKRKEVFEKIQSNLLNQRRQQLIQEWLTARLMRPKTQLPSQLAKEMEQ